MQRRSLIFVVISILVVALVCGSFTPFIVFAEPPDPDVSSGTCTVRPDGLSNICCKKIGPYKIEFCQGCRKTATGFDDCDPIYIKSKLEQPPTPQPFDPAAPLQDGVLEQPPTPPPSGPVAPLKGGVLEQLEQGNPEIGFSERQQQQPPPTDQGVAELPATEGTQPATVEEVPELVCPEGQVIDEETGLCVLEETEVVEEPEEQSTEEEADSSEENSNN